MIILIAESKTMSTALEPVRPASFPLRSPRFLDKAEEIDDFFRKTDTEELSRRLSVSPALAAKAASLFHDFPDVSSGIPALKAFTGEVFRALSPASLSPAALKFAGRHLMIVSSMYGILKPDDIIKPYRLDFNVEIPEMGIKLRDFWNPPLTEYLISLLAASGETEILDLMPAEAARCFNWKEIKQHAEVAKADFKTVADGGSLKTPHSGRLKQLRGFLLREILENGIDNADALAGLETPRLAYLPESPGKYSPTFVSLL